MNIIVQTATHTRNHSLLERPQFHEPTSLTASLPWTRSTFHCADNLLRFRTSFAMARISRSLPSCAAMVWSIFQRSWRRYFSTPDVMITDGGPEFPGDFVHSEKYAGILQVIVDADAPWQNGKCERHGGIVKDLLAKGYETEVVSYPTIWKTFWQRLCP